MFFKKYNGLLFSSLGAAFEYYDLAIYAVFATNIANSFFTKNSTISNTLLIFVVYVVGYAIRPLGAWTFGYIADRKGKMFVLQLNMILLFFSTMGLALLPSVQSIGIIATVLLVFLRCLQCLAIGAEIPVAVVYAIEHYPKRQGLVTGIIFCCLGTGIMMTSLVLFVLNHFTDKTFIQIYGWRVGFFIGACFTLSLFFLRSNITTIPKVITATEKSYLHNLKFIIRVLLGITLVACIAMLTTQLYIFLPSFYKMYGSSKFDISNLLLSGSIIMSISCLIGGFISDYISKLKMMTFLVVTSIVIAVIFYNNIITGNNIYPYFMFLSIVMGFFASTYNPIIAGLFKSEYRCRGYGLAYSLGYLIFSAGVPALSIYLISVSGNLLIPVYLIVFSSAISLVGIIASNYVMKKV